MLDTDSYISPFSQGSEPGFTVGPHGYGFGAPRFVMEQPGLLCPEPQTPDRTKMPPERVMELELMRQLGLLNFGGT